MRKSGNLILLFITIITLSAVRLQAAIVPSGTDRWVAVGGKDVGDCSSRNAPCSSIQYAIKSSDNTDIVHVYDGTYEEDINFIGKAVTLQSVNGPKKTVIYGSGTTSVVTFSSGEQSTSVLKGFSITHGSSSDGGGLYINSSAPVITNCSIRGNTADDDGGGIYSYKSSPTITNCIISDNSASDVGGGIYNLASASTITDCSIKGNSASYEGGGIFTSSEPSLSISRCIINGNSAPKGSGIFIVDSTPIVANCIISGNAADYGGGIYSFHDASPTLVNSTISGNHSLRGGALYIHDYSTAFVVNSILWGNNPDMVTLGSDSSISVEYSDTQSSTPGPGNIQMDPLFVSPISASEAPSTGGDFHLKDGSPCIDAGTGDTTLYPFIPENDIDNDVRPQGRDIDMGADENPYGGYLWDGASDIGGGWYWLGWLGYFNLDFAPWIYHLEHNFLYPFGTSTESIVFWDSAMGAFWWTSDTQYPYVYRFSDGEWLWYLEGSSGPRWFVRISDSVWEQW